MPNGLCPNLKLSGPTYATFRGPRLPVLLAGNSITISLLSDKYPLQLALLPVLPATDTILT